MVKLNCMKFFKDQIPKKSINSDIKIEGLYCRWELQGHVDSNLSILVISFCRTTKPKLCCSINYDWNVKCPTEAHVEFQL